MDNLAEKYRPQTTNELLGQPNVDLVFDLVSKYVAPSYLFFGPPGTGKTTSAKLMISKVENKPTEELYSFKSDIIEYNCGMNGNVEEIKELISGKCNFPPRILSRKYIILDEAQMLTLHAQNSLLNIMEIPPHYLTFILCTTEPKKVIQAVKSRCLQVKFLPGETEDLVNNLVKICEQENIKFDQAGLEMIAKSANGSFREAIMILSQYQTIGATTKNVSTYVGLLPKEELDEMLVSAISGEYETLIEYIDKIQKTSIKPEEVLKECLARFTEIIRLKISDKTDESELFNSCEKIPLIKVCDVFADAIRNISPITPDNMLLQISLFKLASIASKT